MKPFHQQEDPEEAATLSDDPLPPVDLRPSRPMVVIALKTRQEILGTDQETLVRP